MYVSLLGPLQVIRGDDIATPSAGKLRQLLSLLALCANGIVRTEQIIEELWEQCPPVSVSTTLQTYIYLLRKDLDLGRSQPTRVSGAGESWQPSLQTSASGYQLSLEPGMLDSLRFEQLAERGRVTLDAGKTAAAADTLAEALRLWRGPALVDVTCGPLLQAEVLRLEENRKSTLENRIDADLALGRHMELLGELTALTAKHPTHEGFPARLMKALYRAGRRSDALGVYQRLRYSLADELGLDPSADIRQLHQSILNADPLLDMPKPEKVTAAAPVRVVPSQIPASIPMIVGRTQQLAEILDLLTAPSHDHPSVVMIAGPPGSGTTSICTHVSRQVRECYPDGQFFARMLDHEGRRVSPAKVLEDFLRAIGVPEDRMPPSVVERAYVFQEWARSRKTLVMLDDVVDISQVDWLLPANPDSALLVTCRRRLSIPSVTTLVNIPPLSVEEGVQLLIHLMGRERVEREPAAARRLVDLCDGLPAALQGAAACLLVRPHWTLERLVARKEYELAVSATATVEPADDPMSIWASVKRTYQIVPRPAQIALGRLTTLPATVVSLDLAASALGIDEHLAESILEELVEFQLLETESDAERENGLDYWFLPTLRRIGHQLAGAGHKRHGIESGTHGVHSGPRGEQGLSRVS